MIIVRDIITHASARKLEWLMAGLFIHLGFMLLGPYPTFEGKAFVVMAQYATENTWAWIFLLFGTLRTCVLILNGTHIKPSAEVRLILSACSFVILCIWVWGIDLSDIPTTSSVINKWLALGELANVWQSRADMLKRKGSAHHGSR